MEKLIDNASPFLQVQFGLLYSRTGKPDRTRSVLEALEKRAETEYISSILRGALLAELGQETKAIEYLRKGYEEREEYIIMLLHFDKLSYEGLRTHPDFLDVMKHLQPL